MSYNKKIIVLLFLIFTAPLLRAQTAGSPGSFSRMGFGARGMGMGNAFAAVTRGEMQGYYNPSAVALLKENSTSAAYGILSLDRKLNALFYTQPIDTNAGVSVGILNSGVSQIDGRDIDGYHTEMYSTSENLFFLSFALRIKSLAFGLTTKLYYYQLFKELSATSVAFDFGVVYPITSKLSVAAVFKDFNAKYRWDTSNLYGQLGNSTTEKFPSRQTIGISYAMEDYASLLSAEIERSSLSTTILRIGAEITPISAVTIRGGVDGWDVSKKNQAHPSFGFTVRTGVTDWQPSVNYAYILEPYGMFAMHIVSLSLQLK